MWITETADILLNQFNTFLDIVPFSWISLLIVLKPACLGGQLGINCPSAFLKMFTLLELNESNFKILKKYEHDLSQKSSERNMWLLVNRTNPTNTLKLISFNSGQ